MIDVALLERESFCLSEATKQGGTTRVTRPCKVYHIIVVILVMTSFFVDFIKIYYLGGI